MIEYEKLIENPNKLTVADLLKSLPDQSGDAEIIIERIDPGARFQTARFQVQEVGVVKRDNIPICLVIKIGPRQ